LFFSLEIFPNSFGEKFFPIRVIELYNKFKHTI
jgi:hypothetical protein